MGEISALKILEQIKNTPPVLSADGKSIALPQVENGFEVSLYGSSNHTVIDLNGNVYSPLFDTNVTVMYRVINKVNTTDTAIDNFTEVGITIPGVYKEQGENKKPQTIPSVREWKGESGEFTVGKTSKIFYKDNNLKAIAQKIQMYFETMLGITLETSNTDGDIVLEFSDKAELGKEGYTVEITAARVVIAAPTEKGVLYGGTTITQILFDKKAVPCGIIRDYPQYPTRSLMLDLGRTFIELDYLREFVRYAAYFKINEVHMHINDNGGENSSAFRVESKKFPQINSTLKPGQMFSQEDYKAYQKEAEEYGIEIMNEIDTPGHCGFLQAYDEEISLRGMMDITNDEKYEKSVKFIKELFDEFLDGDDPVFRGSKVHIGNDEYWVDGMHEQQRKYMDEIIKYINAKGRTPQYWAVLGDEEGNGVTGKNPVSNEAILSFWIDAATNPALMIEQGHKFVNCDVREALYICPSNPFYGNQMYINAEWNYDHKDVNKVVGYQMPMASPLLLGYEPTFWNDFASGISQLDVFESVKDAFLYVSEKAWYGKNTGEMTGKDFAKLVSKFGKYAPGVNPAKYCKPNENGIMAKFVGSTDLSGNGHTMNLNGVKEVENVLVFDGKSSISLDIDEVGYYTTLSMDIYIDESTPENALLFADNDTKIFLNYCGTGKIGYERQGYKYSFDYVLDTNRMQNIMITTALRDPTHIEAGLCVDGVFVAKGGYRGEKRTHFNSSSLSIPLGRVGEGLIGKIGKIELIAKNTFPQDINGKNEDVEKAYTDVKALLGASNSKRFAQIVSVFENGLKLEDNDVLNLLANRIAKLSVGDFAACQDASALAGILCEDIDKVDYSSESFNEYARAKLVGISVLCNPGSDCDAIEFAVKRITAAKEQLVIAVPLIAEVVTNREQWKDYVVTNVIEEDDELFYWQSGPQVPNDHITFKFSHPLAMDSFTLVSCGDDRLFAAELQVSPNGVEWKMVGDLSDMGDERTLEFESQDVLAVRILIKDHSVRWIKIKKVEFNNGKLVDTLYLEKELARQYAEDEFTAESFGEYKAKRNEAEKVMANPDKLQKQVSEALLELKKARINLKKS